MYRARSIPCEERASCAGELRGSAQGQASLGNAMRPKADGKWQVVRHGSVRQDQKKANKRDCNSGDKETGDNDYTEEESLFIKK